MIAFVKVHEYGRLAIGAAEQVYSVPFVQITSPFPQGDRLESFNEYTKPAEQCRLLARSVSARTHRVFPELGVDRLCHRPAGYGRPCEGFRMTARRDD